MADPIKVVKKTTKKKVSKKVVKKAAKKTVKKNPVGRPTKFVKGMGAIWFDHFIKLESMIKASHAMNLHHETVLEWAKIHPEFSDAIKKAKEIGKDDLCTKALEGDCNPVVALFLLKCNHGMIEEDKRQTIQLKRDELDAKIAGDVNEEKDYTFNFGIAPNPHLNEE